MESFTWFDEMLANIHSHIETKGWSLMAVLGDRHRLPWCYTIGLLEKFDHPELVMIGLDEASMGAILNEVASQVADGRRLVAGDRTLASDMPVLLDAVNDAHWDQDLFAKWWHYYLFTGVAPSPQTALQVLWPDDDGCFPGEPHWDRAHDRCQPRLSLRRIPPRKPGGCSSFS